MMKENNNVSRRSFLKTGAGLGSGLVISFFIPAYAGRLKNVMDKMQGETVFAPNAFLRIGTDNKIKILLAHAEMGQGIWTTLTMMIADELDADWKDIEVEHAPAAAAYFHTQMPMQITGGSSTTYSEFDRYRTAGASARILLVMAAAQKLGVAIEACKTENGHVLAEDKMIPYGELVTIAATLKAPEKIPLRTKEQWKYIGKGLKRLDAPDKVNGKAKFGIDYQAKGLLTAVVAHSPVMGGTVKSFDDSKAKLIKGVQQIVKIPTGVAVIADNFWAAMQGKKALQIEWNLGENVSVDSNTQLEQFRKLAATEGLPAAKSGDVKMALQTSSKLLEAEYIFPYLAHAAMEPLNCTVKITGDKCDIWTGTQMPGMDQFAAATILGFKPDQVQVHTLFLGGAFGRRANPKSDFVVEAVHIAKETGKFIKMIWTREDDTQGGYYRPSFLHKVIIGTNQKAMPVAWQHTIVGQSLLAGTPFEGGIKNGIDDSSTEGVADSPYLSSIPHYYVGLHSPKINIPVLWLRSVGNTHTAFVMETLMDELAFKSGMDAVAYRRILLKNNKRPLAALDLAAEKAGWGKPLENNHFQGVAFHESFGSFVAQVAEISLDTNGSLKIHKVTCAIDCGLAVNPDGVRAQIESGINYALSIALYGEISFKNGQVQQSNFNNYRVLRINEAPAKIEVHIVNSSDKMGGVGEPGVPPLAPALANAIFAATGKRIRRLPFGDVHLKV